MSAEPQPQTAAEYLPWVGRIVHRLARRLPPEVAVDDLISAGVVGLMEALRRFDPGRGHNFPTFASSRIKGAVLDELRKSDMMARDARRESKRIERAVGQFTARHHRQPSEHEAASALGLQIGEYRRKLETLMPVRLNSFDEQSPAGADSSQTNAFETICARQTRERLARAIEQLGKRQQQVLHLYYRRECTLREIGEILQVTESRACQILAAATLQLRAQIGGAEATGSPLSRREAKKTSLPEAQDIPHG